MRCDTLYEMLQMQASSIKKETEALLLLAHVSELWYTAQHLYRLDDLGRSMAEAKGFFL
jgi:hypothetical protein